MSDTAATAIFYCLVLLLPLSALLARRSPLKSSAKMVLAWVAIFVVGMILVSGRDHYKAVWSNVAGSILGSDQSVSGTTTRIRMSDDGHFWAAVDINGTRRRMLIDSGATTTALSVGTAKAAGIDIEESMFPTILDTANGSVSARVSTAHHLRLGTITATDLPVVVSPAFGDTDVIGMNFLSRLASWKVEGSTIILEPKSV